MTRDLRALFEPRSVAVVGASAVPGKWGNWIARGALAGEDRRAVYLVNRNGGEILGHQAYRSIAELPESPELVVVTVPADSFEEAVDGALAAGAKGLVVISAGLGETGPEGQAREEAVVQRVRDAGTVLIGPNCLGIYDATSDLHLSSDRVPAGSLGFVTQSGNLGLELGLLMEDVGMGYSRLISVGNQADVQVAELVEDLASHEPTRVIAVYCEDFKDGRAFARAAQTAVEAGKPVLLLAGGWSAPSARAARSHTGALVSGLAAIDAACAAGGIQRVSTPKELVDAALALLSSPPATGRTVGVVSDGGGSTVLAADLTVSAGLELPELGEELQEAVGGFLPRGAARSNPVDLAGAGESDVMNFAHVVEPLLAADEIDLVFLTGYFGGYEAYSDQHRAQELEAAAAMARAAAEHGSPLVVQTMYWRSAAAEALREGGVPVYRDFEGAVAGITVLVRAGTSRPHGVPELPEPVSPVEAAGYWDSRELLSAAGIAFAEARRASGPDEALAAAEELGYPVVLKALGREHKSDAGGVAVGIPDAGRLEERLSNMATLATEGYSVERTAPVGDGLELIVGARRDPRFGPVTLVGMGGLYAELLADVAVALAPVDEPEAVGLLRSLRGAPLFAGARGRPPLDVPAAASAVAAVSRFAAEHSEVAEVEVNPLLVLPDGALGLDARIILGDGDMRDAG